MPNPQHFLAAAAAALVLAAASPAAAQAEAPDPTLPPRPAAAPAPTKRAPKAPRRPAPARPSPAPAEVPVDPYGAPEVTDAPAVVPARLGLSDLGAMQGLLAVQRFGGWLLRGKGGENPVAVALVAPMYQPQHPWFYWVPQSGEPTVLCHDGDVGAFDKVRGAKKSYATAKDLDKALRGLLRGAKTVAMELVEQGPGKPAAPPPDVRAALRASRVTAQSSEHLLQYTNAIWGEDGYLSHHIAVHHLVELRKEALAFIAEKLRAKAQVTDWDVRQLLIGKMAVRSVVGEPFIATGANTANWSFAPSDTKPTPIAVGDLVVLRLAVRLGAKGSVWASQSWVAVAGPTVPEPAARAFAEVVRARDAAIEHIGQKLRNRQPVRGQDVDVLVRRALAKSYPAERIMHPTGHSLDTALRGSGVRLDSVEKKDARVLVVGTGATVGPGLYFPGELGVIGEVTVYFSPSGPVVTTPAQTAIEILLPP